MGTARAGRCSWSPEELQPTLSVGSLGENRKRSSLSRNGTETEEWAWAGGIGFRFVGGLVSELLEIPS